MLSSGNILIPNKCFEPPGGSNLVITRKTSNSKSICLVPHHASEINSPVFVFPSHFMSNTHIVYAIRPYVAFLFKNVFFTLRHRPPPVFPMSHSSSNQHLRPFPLRALIPFHLFLIDTLYFSGRQLRPGSKNTSTQVQQSNTVVVLLSCGGGLLHKLCLTPFLFLVGLTQYTHRCSCSSWLSIPMTTGVRAIATGRWREDRVKAAQKYTLFCVSKYSKYTPLVQH